MEFKIIKLSTLFIALFAVSLQQSHLVLAGGQLKENPQKQPFNLGNPALREPAFYRLFLLFLSLTFIQEPLLDIR